MESQDKKPVFEPVSVEEAKKIRALAGSEREYPPSGLECSSGSDGRFDPCRYKVEWSWCCWDDGSRHYGRCKKYPTDPEGQERLFCDTTGYNKL